MFGLGLLFDVTDATSQQFERQKEIRRDINASFNVANHAEKVKIFDFLFKKNNWYEANDI